MPSVVTHLETERLLLDELEIEDAPFLLSLLNDEAYIEHIGDREVRTLAQAEDYLLNRIVASYNNHGFGMYAARLKSNGDTIGLCGLVKRDGLEDIDIGYGFLPSARGKGYALEAARCVKQWAAEELRFKRLVAIVSPANKPSVTLLENLGMHLESMVRLPGDPMEICLYAWEQN
jgi:RimJ/RimL family protein N-acetyltransferase